jgi:hypothetical protein
VNNESAGTNDRLIGRLIGDPAGTRMIRVGQIENDPDRESNRWLWSENSLMEWMFL